MWALTPHSGFFRKFGRVAVATSVVCAVLVACPNARATLGDNVTSVNGNHQRLGGERSVLKLANGERHDMRLPSGTVVHQYVSSAGVVYAIAWRGPRKPDLRELLGTYFGKMAQAKRVPIGGHHIVIRRGDDLVVDVVGRPRSSSGRAWVPSLVPTGVNTASAID
jgi:hypothetical protein